MLLNHMVHAKLGQLGTNGLKKRLCHNKWLIFDEK